MSKSIHPGTLAFVKTSGEQCFVLDVSEAANEGVGAVSHKNFSGKEAFVRIPVLTEEGIAHVTKYFLVEELETAGEKTRREFAELMEAADSDKSNAKNEMEALFSGKKNQPN